MHITRGLYFLHSAEKVAGQKAGGARELQRRSPNLVRYCARGSGAPPISVLLSRTLATRDQAARLFIRDEASFVRSSSVCFSSCRVSCSNCAASSNPSCLAQLINVP
jgi:hypothetical protein